MKRLEVAVENCKASWYNLTEGIRYLLLIRYKVLKWQADDNDCAIHVIKFLIEEVLTKMGESAAKRIISDPAILGGKPVIEGTRIAVYLILDLLSEGHSFDNILSLYPHLTLEDIKACIQYAAKVCQTTEIAESFGVAAEA